VDLLHADLRDDVLASLAHLCIGYALGVATGLALAVACTRFAAVGAIVDPLIELLRPISAIAWIPLAILMFGISARVPVFLIFYASLFPIFVNTVAGVTQVDARLVHAAQMLGASPRMILLVPGVLRHGQGDGGDPDHRRARLLLRHAAAHAAGAHHALEPRQRRGRRAMNARRAWLPLAFFTVAIVAWQAAVVQSGQRALYPYPAGVLEAAARTVKDGSLLAATSNSLLRVLIGFAIGAACGIPLGVLMGFVRPVGRAVSPIIDSLRSIAPIAWIPMALLWLGIRGNAALFIVAYAAFFPFVVNAAQGARLIDRNLVNAARALGASRALVVRSVVLPNALPAILTGARISMAFAWGSIIAAELAMGIKVTSGGSGAVGLGQLMVSTLYVRRDVNGLVLYMIVIGVISLAIDLAMRRLQRGLTPWRRT
jgi:ABC-type nitrate/sulfonate/bicarbonate transport system permease component